MTIAEQLENLIEISQKIIAQINEGDWSRIDELAVQRNEGCRNIFQMMNYSQLAKTPDRLQFLAVLDKEIVCLIQDLKINTEQRLNISKQNRVAKVAYLSHSS